MRKQPPKLDWQIVESEAEWERQQALLTQGQPPVAGQHPFLHQYGWPLVALLLLLGVAGTRWWQAAQARTHPLAGTTQVTAQLASTLPYASDLVTRVEHHRRDMMLLQIQYESASGVAHSTAQLTTTESYLDLDVQTVEPHGDLAIAKIVLADPGSGAPVYRQTRFYWRASTGWQPTPPDATLWGTEQSLTTPYFVFHYGQHDTATVLAVAPQLDALYTTLWHNFGLPIDPMPDKVEIDVRVTQNPGEIAPWFEPTNQLSAPAPARYHLVVPSPARYLAPVALSDTQLLAQSIALPLLKSTMAQARAYQAIGQAWQPLLDGLVLWQLWDLDLPLAAWRKEIVQWLFIDLPAVQPGQNGPLPPHYHELCTAHQLWLATPADLHIPLLCTAQDLEKGYWYLWRFSPPATQLARLWVSTPASLGSTTQGVHYHPGQIVALATLIEYAVATYGRERLPLLVASLGQYNDWDTLLPAVYGVSSAEFEAGWQHYLAMHYGVTTGYKLR